MGQIITLTAADGHHLEAYEAGTPDAPRALVLIQEIFGVNAFVRAAADAWAERGFHVIAPALFDRAEPGAILPYTQEGMQKGLALRAKVTEDQVLADVEAAAKALNSRKTGIIGFCWGGLVAWLAATRTHSFRAASGWYGGGIAKYRDEKPHCPVQLHFGGEDEMIPHTDVQAIRAAQKDIELFVYDDAGHGFGCPDRPGYNADATELATSRSLGFFEATL